MEDSSLIEKVSVEELGDEEPVLGGPRPVLVPDPSPQSDDDFPY